jgi:hypothetical protein
MPGAPGKAVKPEHDNRIESPIAGVSHQLVELGPAIFASADPNVNILCIHIQPAVVGVFSQLD